jgi:two-component system sensor histidine kinase/response regulator
MSADYGKARILLVEDSPLNQDILLSLFEEWHLGADVAGSGWEAIAALRQRDYDLVFMDVQMPGMDGLEATVKVRNPDNGARNAKVPIVAMTADTGAEDRQRCLDAGMNDYLAKPFADAELQQVLDRYLAKTAEPAPGDAPAEPAPSVFDGPALLRRLLGNRAAAVRVVRTCLRDMPGRMARLQDTIERGDVARAAGELHTLKGSAASLAGEAARAKVLAMEVNAKDGDLGSLRLALPGLQREIERLCKALEAYLS